MKVILLYIGKTQESYLQEAIGNYLNRLRHYLPVEPQLIPDLKNAKNLREEQQKEKEGQLLLGKIQPGDSLVLLDERGRQYRSVEFARFFQERMNSGVKRLVFAIGGPYGFSDAVYQRANEKLSLSKMTFSHQMVRLFFVEQVYRAMTILRNEPYHHE